MHTFITAHRKALENKEVVVLRSGMEVEFRVRIGLYFRVMFSNLNIKKKTGFDNRGVNKLR